MSKIDWSDLQELHAVYVGAMQYLSNQFKNDPVNVIMAQTSAKATWENELGLSTEALRGYLVATIEEIEGLKEAVKEKPNVVEGQLLMGYLIVAIMKYHHMMEYAPE